MDESPVPQQPDEMPAPVHKKSMFAPHEGSALPQIPATTAVVSPKAALRLHHKILAGGMAAIFLFAFYVTLDANKYRAELNVIEGEGKVGVNPTSESLDFGDLSRGSQAVRKVKLANGTGMPVYIVVWKFGSLSELMTIDHNYFRLASHDETEINFATYVPASAGVGTKYTGRVYLLKIPTFWL